MVMTVDGKLRYVSIVRCNEFNYTHLLYSIGNMTSRLILKNPSKNFPLYQKRRESPISLMTTRNGKLRLSLWAKAERTGAR